MEYLGVELPSFQKCSKALARLLEVNLSPKEVEKLTEKFGKERVAERQSQVERFEKRQLKPLYTEAPGTAVISVDGGRCQIREPDAGPGVHDPQWIETKVAHVATFTHVQAAVDPRPEPPKCYLDRERVPRLVEELKGARAKLPGPRSKPVAAHERKRRRKKKDPLRPRPKVRTVVGTTQDVEHFGALVAVAAFLRGFYKARKKAFLGDGSPWIWGLRETHFPGFTGILDFLHLLSKLYGAACAVHRQDGEKRWKLYIQLIRLAWSGRAQEVLEVLRRHSQRLGPPSKDARDEDPRKVLQLAVAYVEQNRGRMEYPRYRREGLPIHSGYVESLIKQVNRRVKGTEKFWLRQGLEAMLESRAAYLSDDGRAEEFWKHRPAATRAVGGNRFRQAA